MQSCLAVGAYCVIDVHNFARWNGGIIGQGGPTNVQFADLWTQLATKYADNEFVIFELMNEPHELIFDSWVVSAQAAVNAIRAAETVSHIILLPGDTFSSAGTFISSGWGAAMAKITNPDKSTTNLIFDLHKYLDIDNSGDHEECVMDNVAATFEPVAAWLRTNKRRAILSETGAAASDSVSISNFSQCNSQSRLLTCFAVLRRLLRTKRIYQQRLGCLYRLHRVGSGQSRQQVPPRPYPEQDRHQVDRYADGGVVCD
jgi:endoglucanase